MDRLLKILHLEDLQSDADMVARVLRKAGINGEILHVSNKDSFINALKNSIPDIILSDHSLPSLDSHEAISIVKQMGIEVPFILVTATVSEEYAVDIMKGGAVDYILKDRLQRLPNAVLGAMEKHNLLLSRKKADEILRASERKYKLLFESNPLPMWMFSRETFSIIAVNNAAVTHYGYSKQEFLSMSAKDLRPEEDIDAFVSYLRGNLSGKSKAGIWRHKKKNGAIIMVDIISHDVLYEDIPTRLILANDVTEKLAAEAELAKQQALQQKLVAETSIQVQEHEREEIGKELHDNINQILATSKLYLDHAIKKEGLQSELLNKSKENILLAVEEIRKLSHSLVAPPLEGITLTDAIRELIEDLHSTQSLCGKLQAGDNFDETLIHKNIKLMLYRIVQEQINNILKYARAKHMLIRLESVKNGLLLTVQDDGVGFDTSKIPDGIGLRNIKNRAGFYDGTARIRSAPGKGCILEVTIPQ